jgi:hypothetical protein
VSEVGEGPTYRASHPHLAPSISADHLFLDCRAVHVSPHLQSTWSKKEFIMGKNAIIIILNSHIFNNKRQCVQPHCERLIRIPTNNPDNAFPSPKYYKFPISYQNYWFNWSLYFQGYVLNVYFPHRRKLLRRRLMDVPQQGVRCAWKVVNASDASLWQMQAAFKAFTSC